MEALDRLDPAGQGALHRLLELFRLAHHEGARRRRHGRAPALRQPADPLHAAGARGRIRTGADLPRPGPRHPRLEPARRRPALRQVPPRQPGGTGRLPPLRPQMASSRRSTTRTSCSTSSMSSSTSPRRTIARRRAWRSPGCCISRASPRSSSAGAREEQFADNLAAADLKLGADELKRLDEVSRPNLAYPYWHQTWSANERFSPADLSLTGKYLDER